MSGNLREKIYNYIKNMKYFGSRYTRFVYSKL